MKITLVLVVMEKYIHKRNKTVFALKLDLSLPKVNAFHVTCQNISTQLARNV